MAGSLTLLLLAAACAPAVRTGVTPAEPVELDSRRALTEQAKRAIQDEQVLAASPPVPNTIAVLPWTYLGGNPELKPLERGLAHLVVNDLAKVSRFTLLQRERVQALTEELALASSVRVDSATAARSGRLLRAAQVVSGTILDADRGGIRLDATVVNASTSEMVATGTASDQLQQLFSMEKAVVLDLLGRMGVSLTPAERRALDERPTADLQAFLAFSRGLMAEDRGDWPGAARSFQAATAADPSFSIARDRAARSVRLSVVNRSGGSRPGALANRRAGSVRAGQLAAALQNIAPSIAGRLNRSPNRLGTLRSRLAEALRQDDPTRLGTTGQIIVTIPRP